MSKHNHFNPDGRGILQLTRWELENLHLPPVTTVTLYEGTAPLEFLRRRLTKIIGHNPWLTSRIVKKNTPMPSSVGKYWDRGEIRQAVCITSGSER